MASDKTENEPSHQAPSSVTTTAARAHLECIAGPEKGQKLRVAPAVTVLGRDPMCDVVLSESVISRQHARIERRGDQWILKNLSSNGTLLNHKPVDEAVLADHDEIRLGAATRLRFVVETVMLSSTGRPQFRRRVTAQEEAAAKEAAEGQPAAAETKPSIFKRRKGLVIGLLIWFGVVFGLIVLAFVYPHAITGGHAQIPVLGLEDMVYPGPGATPLKIIGDRPEGVVGEDTLGRHIVVPRADIDSGQAVIIPGIRKAMDVKFTLEYNPAQAQECQRQALELYQTRYNEGKIGALFASVRLFQQSMAYAGGKGYIENPTIDAKYQEALKEIIARVDSGYRNAIITDRADHPKEAKEAYEKILALVPDHNNIVYINVAWRLSELKSRHPELK